MRIDAKATGQPSCSATDSDRRPIAPLNRQEQEQLLHVIERVVRDWPDLAHVSWPRATAVGGLVTLVLHSAARDLLVARNRLRIRLGEELRPDRS